MANFYMSNTNWNKLQNYAKHAWTEYNSEIGGFLIAEQDKDNKWKMHKPVILKQEISGGNTVLDKDALAEYYVKTAMKMKDKPFQFVWWHSHHTMAVFWSATDLTAIEEFSNGTMSVSLVINLEEEYKLRVNLWKPYAMHEDVEMDIINKPDTKAVPKAIQNSVDTLCSEPVSKIIVHKASKRVNPYNRSQQTLWGKQAPMATSYDLEMVQVEAKIDNILVDYITSLNYDKYVIDVKKLNTQLKKDKSELRCGLVGKQHEQYLFTAMASFDSNEWVHSKGTNWSFVDKAIEYDLGDGQEYGGYNDHTTL